MAVAVVAFLGFILRAPVWAGSEMKSSAQYRLALYRSSLEIAKDFPLFGTGLASYQTVFPAYQDASVFQERMEHAHSDWLEILTESGTVGLTAYLAGLFVAFAIAAKAWLVDPASDQRCLTGACLAAALSFSLHGFVDFSFSIPGNAVLFLTLLVCAATAVSRNGQPHEI